MFIGRNDELSKLDAFYQGDESRLFVLYGRQGMGKTALLREFARDKENIFFTAYSTTDRGETALLSQAIAKSEGKGISRAHGKDEPLDTLLDKITEKAKSGRLLFIIDHYPDFAKADDAFEKELHRYMKEVWATLPVKLILCGDSFLSMEKRALSPKCIWKDIPSERMQLESMGFYEARGFFGGRDAVMQAFLYGVTGGIPSLLAQAKKLPGTAGEREVIDALFLSDTRVGLLPERTAQIDLREMAYYNRLLTSLADGKSRVNQISEEVGKPKDTVVPYMNTLMSIGMVTKESPVTERTNRKKTRYSIVNTNDLFWYRFIAPYIEAFVGGEDDALFSSVISSGISGFMENVFIGMCREYLLRACEKGDTPFTVTDIGNWWENDEEKHTSEGFDLVAVGETDGDDAMIFARCYYEDEPIGILTLKELIELTKHVKDKSNAFYLIFSKSGFQENTETVAKTIKNIMLISLKDICE